MLNMSFDYDKKVLTVRGLVLNLDLIRSVYFAMVDSTLYEKMNLDAEIERYNGICCK